MNKYGETAKRIGLKLLWCKYAPFSIKTSQTLNFAVKQTLFCQRNYTSRAIPFHAFQQTQTANPKITSIEDALASIQSSIKSGQLDVAKEQLQTIRDHVDNTKAWSITYTMLLEAYMKRHDTNSAEEIFFEILDSGLPVDEHVYGSLINGYLKAGNFKIIELIVEKMKQTGVTPNAYIYSMLIKGYFSSNNILGAEAVYDIVKQRNLVNAFIITTMLDGYANHKQLHKATILFSDIQKYKVEANEVLYSAFLKCYIEAGKLKMANELFHKLLLMEKVNQVTFNLMLKAFIKSGNFDAALELYEKVSKLVPPNIFIVNQMIEYFLYINAIPGAEQFLQHAIQKYNVTPNLYTYNLLLNAFARTSQKKKAEDIYNKWIPGANLLPDDSTYHAMLNLYSQIGYHQDAEKFFSKITEKSTVAYNALLKAHVLRTKRTDKAEQLYEQMKLNKVPMNQHTFYTMLKGYSSAGKAQRGKQFIESDVMPFLKSTSQSMSEKLQQAITEINQMQ